jgi:hypothetical protein
MVTPFSFMPYMWGFAAWVIATGIVYVFAAKRVMPAPFVLAQPTALINGWIGQNAFVTSAIFVTGVSMLKARPFAAGAVLGLLVIKPQLALLLPVAVVAARLWPAIAGAAASAAALLLVSLLLFGAGAFEGFWNILPIYGEMMRNDKWPWNEFISVFAFLRWFGADQSLAMILHGLVAAAAAIVTWRAWAADWEQKVPVLASATLLIPPYLLTYDALLLILPMGYWLGQKARPVLAIGLWILSLLPITFYFDLYRGPNTIPLAAILALLLLVRERRGRSASPNVDHAHAV